MAPESGADLTAFERDIARVLSTLADGEIVSYGEVAAEAGRPGAARAVGAFLQRHEGHPWWRVVNAQGRLVPGKEAEHARRLRAEGVPVENGRVKMARPDVSRRAGRPVP